MTIKSYPAWTHEVTTGCGDLHIIINHKKRIPFQMFGALGKSGGCASSQIEAVCRVVSLAFKAGVSIKDLRKQLSGISCHAPYISGDKKTLSCADGISQCLAIYMDLMAEEENAAPKEPEKITENK